MPLISASLQSLTYSQEKNIKNRHELFADLADFATSNFCKLRMVFKKNCSNYLLFWRKNSIFAAKSI